MKIDPNFTHDTKISKEWQRMLSYPRVIKAEDLPTLEGKSWWIQMIIRWNINSPATSISNFIQHFAPGAASHKHGHIGEAMFYVLEGKGYEIHDGVKYEWEAGDVVLVNPGGCVHQHFNSSSEKPAKVWVFHCSPVFRVMNLFAERLLEVPPGMTMEEYLSAHAVKVYQQDKEEGGN